MMWGEFCEVFGVNPRNRILEFFLEMRELDFSVGDIAKESGLNRATAYNVVDELIDEGYLVRTRRVSGAQLYKLDLEKKEVKVLVGAFNGVLKVIVKRNEKVLA